MNFQIVKFNRIYEVILMKSCLCMSFEFINIGIQPDWIAQIKFMADFVNCMKNLVCAGVIVINFYDSNILLSLNSFAHNRNIENPPCIIFSG